MSKNLTFKLIDGDSVGLVVTGLEDISERGFEVIREFEGFRENAYLDIGGVWTIGFGTIKYPNGSKVKKGDTCTHIQAETWLKMILHG